MSAILSWPQCVKECYGEEQHFVIFYFGWIILGNTGNRYLWWPVSEIETHTCAYWMVCLWMNYESWCTCMCGVWIFFFVIISHDAINSAWTFPQVIFSMQNDKSITSRCGHLANEWVCNFKREWLVLNHWLIRFNIFFFQKNRIFMINTADASTQN